MARSTTLLLVLLAFVTVPACGRPTAEDVADNQRQSLDDEGDPPPDDPPPNDGSGNVPANDGSGNVPANNGSGNVPANNGSGDVPANDGSGDTPPANDGSGNAPPANDGSGNAPANDGSGNAPANDPSADDPSADDPSSDDPGADTGNSGDTGEMMLASADDTGAGGDGTGGDGTTDENVGAGLTRDNGNTIPTSNGTVVTNDEGTWVQGRMSTFGGPSDTGVTRTETGALTGERLRSLDPNDYYVAMRFPYGDDPDAAKAALADDHVLLRNPDTGDEVVARAVDWGPNAGTGRVVDMSPGSADALGLGTDQQVQVQWAAPGTPLGPRHRSHHAAPRHISGHVACNIGGSSAPLVPGSMSVAAALLVARRRRSRR